MTGAERKASCLTLAQAEALLMIRSGRRIFSRRWARTAGRLVDLQFISAQFGLSDAEGLRGRVHEIWRDCELTEDGERACAVLVERFSSLLSVEAA